jgi:uncharacterized protein (UPF0212 family)
MNLPLRHNLKSFVPMSANKKECPSCAMNIDARATECPICGYEFPAPSPALRWVAWLLLAVFLVYALWAVLS